MKIEPWIGHIHSIIHEILAFAQRRRTTGIETRFHSPLFSAIEEFTTVATGPSSSICEPLGIGVPSVSLRKSRCESLPCESVDHDVNIYPRRSWEHLLPCGNDGWKQGGSAVQEKGLSSSQEGTSTQVRAVRAQEAREIAATTYVLYLHIMTCHILGDLVSIPTVFPLN